MITIHRFVAAADIPAKGQIVTCPHCGQLEVWTHEEIQDHGLCRHLLHRKGGSCPVCKGVWEGRPEWMPLGHISCDRKGVEFPATSKKPARSSVPEVPRAIGRDGDKTCHPGKEYADSEYPSGGQPLRRSLAHQEGG